MKKILLASLFLLLLVGTVSAYGLNLSCPSSVQVGETLKCSIDSDFPKGTTFNLALYQSAYTATEIRKTSITVQENKNTQYVVFDTEGLPGGTYKAEIQYTGADEERLRSGSNTLCLITLIDRSGDIEITSPITQEIRNALRIEGSIKDLANAGVEIEVYGPSGRIFGPQWIQTKTDVKNDNGVFTQKIDVSEGGDYTVEFSDAKGYIGNVMFTVNAPATVTTPVPTLTAAAVKTTRTSATNVPTPWPTTAQSPLSPLAVIAGVAAAGMIALLSSRRNQ
jgi:hypothetical protein